jgi:hypothetical protein
MLSSSPESLMQVKFIGESKQVSTGGHDGLLSGYMLMGVVHRERTSTTVFNKNIFKILFGNISYQLCSGNAFKPPKNFQLPNSISIHLKGTVSRVWIGPCIALMDST